MMRLSERIRRELKLERGTPADQAAEARADAASGDANGSDLIQRLRRQIAKMERPTQAITSRQPLPRGVAARPISETAQSRDAAPSSRKSTPARTLLYQHTYGCADRHGAAPLAPPQERELEGIGRLIALQQQRSGDASVLLSQLLFIDTETTGLSRGAGTLAFIVGVGGFWGPDGAFQVDQIVLHDPAQEPEGLALLAGYLARATVLVSFNGRSFDLPVLRNRGLLNRTDLALCQPHLDLLPWCRRHFRARLPDCRLATVEQQLLGFYRDDDLPGSEAPGVYDAYLRYGEFGEMERLLEHNRHDVAALPALLLRLVRHVLDPLQWGEDAEELLATGAYQIRHGDVSLGEACLNRALELSRWPATRRRALVRLAGHRRRQGRKDEAAQIWQRYREEFPRCQVGWVELAKHHEHTTKDLEQALALTESAPDNTTVEIAHRRERLLRRIARVRRASGPAQA